MKFSQQVLLGLVAGIAAGLFVGETIEPVKFAADAFVRLLQMTVLPYVTLSIVGNLGALSYAQARVLGLRLMGVLAVIWAAALTCALLIPLAFPDIQTAAFYSPSLAQAPQPFNFLDLYVPSNPFHALAGSVVPAVVLFSVFVGVALIGVPRKQLLLDVIDVASTAVGRIARFMVRLTPIGIFAISAHAAGTLDVGQLQRIQIYLVAYVVFTLFLTFWVLPGLVATFTPFTARQTLATSRDALITAFVVGDLFVVLPFLIDACSKLIATHIDTESSELPSSIIPMSFTFPHSGKLLSMSFVLFAGWFSDSVIPLTKYPALLASGFFSFFGSLNVAVPFLLDLFRIPTDTFQLFLATSVVNARFGTLLAAVHTIAVGLIGSTAIAGQLRIKPLAIGRFLLVTGGITLALLVGLRVGFDRFVDLNIDGRSVVNSMTPLVYPPVDNATVLSPAKIPLDSISRADQMLADIRTRGTLRVGLIADGIPYEFRNDRNQVVGFDIEMALNIAEDLGVTAEFVRFPQADLNQEVRARTIDIVMTGARLTPERAAEFATSEPYLDETLAIITHDYSRAAFESWDAIRAMGAIEVGVQNLPYYLSTVRQLLPDARLTVIQESTELIDANSTFAAYILPAERGSVLTMLNPRFTVVVPTGETIKMPLAYPIAGSDPAWIRYVNTWIGLKKRAGFIDRLYNQWILGRAASRKEPRWSIMRNVLHWVP